jgi:hypothetical protein
MPPLTVVEHLHVLKQAGSRLIPRYANRSALSSSAMRTGPGSADGSEPGCRCPSCWDRAGTTLIGSPIIRTIAYLTGCLIDVVAMDLRAPGLEPLPSMRGLAVHDRLRGAHIKLWLESALALMMLTAFTSLATAQQQSERKIPPSPPSQAQPATGERAAGGCCCTMWDSKDPERCIQTTCPCPAGGGVARSTGKSVKGNTLPTPAPGTGTTQKGTPQTPAAPKGTPPAAAQKGFPQPPAPSTRINLQDCYGACERQYGPNASGLTECMAGCRSQTR